MLAAKAHLTLSELVLSHLRADFLRKPNKETLQAHEKALNGDGVDCDSLEDFWEQMEVKPSALSFFKRTV